jgi:hypothetical protein
MTLGDVMTVLMVSKSIRNDCVVDYVSICPSCGKSEQNNIRIPDDLQVNAKKDDKYDGIEKFTLPDSGDVVTCRLMTVADEKYIMERSADDRAKMADHVAHILLPITTIGDGTEEGKVESADEIVTWYNALSPKDADFLEKEQGRRYPQLETDIGHKCDGCGHVYEWSLDLNRDFFRAGER